MILSAVSPCQNRLCYTIIRCRINKKTQGGSYMSAIVIKGARTGNLKNIDATIPKQQFVVLTGVSGCGKSTLAIDTLFQECQRRYLEAMGMQGIQKPKLDSLSGGSPAILITAGHSVNNPRSSLGTMSNIYTDLRMLYEKLSARRCPICHEINR